MKHAIIIAALALPPASFAEELQAPKRPDCFEVGQTAQTLEGLTTLIVEAHCEGAERWYLTERPHDPNGPIRRSHENLFSL